MQKKRIYLLAGLLVIGLFAVLLLPVILDTAINRVAIQTSPAISPAAEEMHAGLWIADLHADPLLWNRNLLKENSRGQVDIPRLIQGNVALQAFTVVSKIPFFLNFQKNSDNTDLLTLLAPLLRWPASTWFSLRNRAIYQAEKLHRFADASGGRFRVIATKSDLLSYIDARAGKREMTAGFLGIEGAQVLENEFSNLSLLFEAGFRMMSPSHFFDTEVGGSAHGVEKGGLTDFGERVVRQMEQLGMIVDVAHASPQTIDDILAIATKPLFVSHTGVRGTCDNIRNLSDQHIKAIAAAGGVIGIAFFEQATCGNDVTAIVDAISYTRDLAGIQSVALGSDFDGAVKTPFDAAHLSLLTDALSRAGFTGTELAAVMGGNIRRLLLELLPN